MYIERVPNRNSPPAVLLRETWRENGKVKKRTIANLSRLPDELIELLRGALKGKKYVEAESVLDIVKSLPHGHVAAVAGTMRNLGFASIIASQPSRERNLVLAMVAARILEPASKLATVRLWNTSTIGEEFGVADASAEELYKCLDWLLKRRSRIERKLIKRHLKEGALVLYDLTSTYVEGRCCPLASYGYSRDRRSDRLQIEFGLVTDREGRPLAVEVFDGNTADPTTLSVQIEKLKNRYGLKHVIIVGDRGMITHARIQEDLKPNGVSWISALRNDDIKRLAEGPLQLSLFDKKNLAEISSPDYPGERLVACRNPTLAAERARKRAELLEATEAGLKKIRASVAAGRLKECGAIGQRVDRVLKRYKMAKHFIWEIKDGQFTFRRNEEQIAREAELDGIYIIRSNVPAQQMDAAQLVRQYKGLSQVEQAFRTIKTISLQVRPVFHYLADRVRAHIFLCMLAYYVEWEMRKRLAPLLFADESAKPDDGDPVAPKEPSERAREKTGTRRSHSGQPLHSFKSILKELATLSRNWVAPKGGIEHGMQFTMLTQANSLQKEAFRLLDIAI